MVSVRPDPQWILYIPRSLFEYPVDAVTRPIFSTVVPDFQGAKHASFTQFVSASTPVGTYAKSVVADHAQFYLATFSVQSSSEIGTSSMSSVAVAQLESTPTSVDLNLVISPVPSSTI